MDKLFGLDVVVDDNLYRRANAALSGFDNESDLYGWLAEMDRDRGAWPRCGCSRRCKACPDHRIVRSAGGDIAVQEIDPHTGIPRPPEWRDLQREAAAFSWESRNAYPASALGEYLGDWIIRRVALEMRPPATTGYPYLDACTPWI